MKRRKFLSHLRKNGCQLIREGGKHSWWGNEKSGARSAVPRHTELSNLLCRSFAGIWALMSYRHITNHSRRTRYSAPLNSDVMFTRTAALLFGILLVLAPTRQVFAAPHLEPCARDEYQATVELLMRRAWHEPMGLLIIMYGRLPERGIGLTKNDDGYRLIRIEFDKSLWYDSWIEYDNEEEADLTNAHMVSRTIHREDGGPLGIQVLDFSKTEVRPSTTSIPISDSFASTLTQALEESVDAAREDTGDMKTLDGYSYEFLMENRSCARLHSPRRDTEAWRIAELVRLLATGAQSWRTWNEEETEARAIDLVDQL